MSGWLRLYCFCGAALLLLLAPRHAAAAPPPAAAATSPTVYRVVIDGGITHSTTEHLSAAFERAQRDQAEAVVVEIDTPGGLLDATRDIVRLILEARIPVVTFVAPQGAHAGSAGLFLVLASHVAAMAPSTNIGASHPVSSFGGEIEGTMKDKVTNDLAAWARSLAETRGRNAEVAEKAVKQSASFTALEAIDTGLVDLGVDNLDALLSTIDGREVTVQGKEHVLNVEGARVTTFEKSAQQALYDWLANPTLLYLLLLAGILGVYLEIQNPGMIVPGVLGAACLGIVFGLGVLPVNTFGVLLIGLAAILFFAEVYVTSFGLLAAAGLACLVVGSYLLFDVEGSTYRLAGSVIWSVAITFAAVFLFFGALLLKAKRQGATSGPEALVGKEAVASEPLGPGVIGRIFMDGTYWNARADVPIVAGAKVRVERIDGLTVSVSAIQPTGDKTDD